MLQPRFELDDVFGSRRGRNLSRPPRATSLGVVSVFWYKGPLDRREDEWLVEVCEHWVHEHRSCT